MVAKQKWSPSKNDRQTKLVAKYKWSPNKSGRQTKMVGKQKWSANKNGRQTKGSENKNCPQAKTVTKLNYRQAKVVAKQNGQQTAMVAGSSGFCSISGAKYLLQIPKIREISGREIPDTPETAEVEGEEKQNKPVLFKPVLFNKSSYYAGLRPPDAKLLCRPQAS